MTKYLLACVAIICSATSTFVYADDYGCKVLLCLANPNGPKAVAECVPPINQLYRELRRGKPFPSCDMASGSSSGGGSAWAQRGFSYYDNCPEGTTALPAGQLAIQGSPTIPVTGSYSIDSYFTGIGEGDGLTPGYGDGYSPLPGKVCVGNRLGEITSSTGYGDGYSTVNVGVFDRVVFLDPQGSPNVIDVYVDSSLYRRVRW